MREISLDLIRVTESAAIAAANFVGSGDKIAADGAATDAMRTRLNNMRFAGTIAIGEGEKDNAPGLFNGEQVGGSWGSEEQFYKYEIALDPIDGTRPTACGGPGALSVMAVSHPNCMFTTNDHYIFKLAVNKAAKNFFSSIHHGKPILSLPLSQIVNGLSVCLHKPVEKLTVCVLDRERHDTIVKELREIGCRIQLIRDCDVTASIAACLPDKGIDMYYGVGGAPEAVIAAAAVKCLGGTFEACPVTYELDNFGISRYHMNGEVLKDEALVKGECLFVATGITDGSLLEGVKFDSRNGKPITNSIFMRSSSGTARWLKTYHNND